jgi:hypothetical protein
MEQLEPHQCDLIWTSNSPMASWSTPRAADDIHLVLCNRDLQCLVFYMYKPRPIDAFNFYLLLPIVVYCMWYGAGVLRQVQSYSHHCVIYQFCWIINLNTAQTNTYACAISFFGQEMGESTAGLVSHKRYQWWTLEHSIRKYPHKNSAQAMSPQWSMISYSWLFVYWYTTFSEL